MSLDPGSDLPGDFGGRFALIRCLGRGGMSVVYEVYDRERETRVALKTLLGVTPERLYALKREFRAVADLRHPNVVALYELFADERGCFLTMELVRGADVVTWLRPAGRGQRPRAAPHTLAALTMGSVPREAAATATAISAVSGSDSQLGGGLTADAADARLPDPRTIGRFAELCDEPRLRHALVGIVEGLRALHTAGIIHRDLKPSNVMVAEDERVLLMDFGIAAHRDQVEDWQRLSGTPLFMAPEQARGLPVSEATDSYALGVMLYYAATGHAPIEGTAQAVVAAKRSAALAVPTVWPPDIPDDLQQLCSRLLDPEPARRPGTGEILRLLREGGAGDDELAETDGIFVGRDSELGELMDGLAASRNHDVLVLIRGASGIGKSTLVRRFFAAVAAQEPAPLILRGRAHERESIPYKGFDGVIDELSSALRSPLLSQLPRPDGAGALAQLFPVLSGWLGNRAGGAEPTDPGRLRHVAMRALRLLLQGIASTRPVILWVDDLQWADGDSIELLRELLADRDDHPGLFVLLSRRSEEAPIDAALEEVLADLPARTCRRMTLQALGRAEQTELVRSVLFAGTADGSATSTEATALAEDFFAEANGNPLFLLELARFARRHLERVRAGWRPSFEDALRERIDELSPEARALLQAMVVAGEPTPLGVLGGVAEVRGAAREEALVMLGAGHFCRMSRRGAERWFDTYHDRIRETLSTLLEETVLTRLHLALAGALRSSGVVSEDRLARHYLAGGDPATAAEFYLQAAERAQRALAFERAAGYYGKVLELAELRGPRRFAVQRAQADCLAGAGFSHEAADAYRRAAELTSAEDSDELLQRAGEQLLRGGHVVEGLDTLREVLDRIGIHVAHSTHGAIPGLLLARARRALRGMHWTERQTAATSSELRQIDLLTSVAVSIGFVDLIRGAGMYERLLVRTLECGEPDRVCTTLSTWTMFRGAEGLHDAPIVVAALAEARRLASTSNNAYARGWMHMGHGYREIFGARFHTGLPELLTAERIFTEECVGADYERITALWTAMMCYVYQGNYALVAERTEECLRDATLWKSAYARALLAAEPNVWRLLLADRPDAAEAAIRGMLDGWPVSYTTNHWRHDSCRAWIALYRGDYRAALDIARAALRQMRYYLLTQVRITTAQMYMLLGLGALGAGDERALRRAITALERCGIEPFAGFRQFLLAGLALRHRDHGTAEYRLREADRLIAGNHGGFAPVQMAARYRLGELLGPTHGRALRAEAMDYFTACGFRAPQRVLLAWAPPIQ